MSDHPRISERSIPPFVKAEPDKLKRPGGWLHRLSNVFGLGNGDGIREQLEKALKSEEDGDEIFSEQERTMLLNILEFGDLRVDDVMVPRPDIIAIDEEAELTELLKLFADAGHSRVPVYRGSIDEPLGMIHIKDLMRWMTEAAIDRTHEEDENLNFRGLDLSRTVKSLNITRDVLYVPPSMPVLALLHRMQATHIHLGIVIDEFGGTDGLVSIEDLIEEVVGNIEDEHDVADEPMIVEDVNGITVDGRLLLDDLNTYMGLNLTFPEKDDDSESVGGLILAILGRLPAPGERVIHSCGMEFEVLDVDQHRIGKVRLHPVSHSEAEIRSGTSDELTPLARAGIRAA